jgi:hypothetical protein
MIVTRDPKGRIEDRAYFATEAAFGIQEIATGFSRRWCQEVLHRDVKQHLGLEDPQNGWWRRPPGKRGLKKAGPQPHRIRGQRAVLHTVPMAFIAYTLVAVWYLKHGSPEQDVQRVRARAPWYRHKQAPSFANMLEAARREFWRARFSATPLLRPLCAKIIKLLSTPLLVG